MKSFSQIAKSLALRYRQHILRDPFLLEATRWVRDKGDDTLRLNYPLNPQSIVFDVGGYHGDFAAAIHQKYNCSVYIFEPVPLFHEHCVARFRGNSKIICLNYGLSSVNRWLDITLAENASSFSLHNVNAPAQRVRVRSIVECIPELRIDRIDLLKINIEGGEFEVIPALLDSNDIKIVRYLQVQFHNFIDTADKQRNKIRTRLEKTHIQMWNYEFIWESWKLKGSGF